MFEIKIKIQKNIQNLIRENLNAYSFIPIRIRTNQSSDILGEILTIIRSESFSKKKERSLNTIQRTEDHIESL